jgi:gamma-glutamylaminecyclotransferase
MLVFVYGTLKRGYWNHDLLSSAPFVGEAVSVDDFRMGNVGSFPEIQLAEIGDQAGRVTGEIYDVDERTLQSLDRLEANGRMYEREELEFEVNGDVVIAWAYLWMGQPTQAIEPIDGQLTWSCVS